MKYRLSIVLFLLLLVVTACGGSAEESNANANEAAETAAVELPTAAATAAPVVVEENNQTDSNAETAVSEPDEEPMADEVNEADNATVDDTAEPTDSQVISFEDDDLYLQPVDTNYRFTITFNSSVTSAEGEVITSRIDGAGARTIEPDAATYVLTLEGGPAADLGGQTFSSTVIEGTNYFVAPQLGCISLTENEDTNNPYEVFLDTGGFFNGEVERVLPNQTINGVEARVYRVERENIATIAVTELSEAMLYVADEGNYIVRAVISGRGTNNLLIGEGATEGEIYYEVNFTPTTETIEITIPAECENTGVAGDSDIPLLDDAVTSMTAQGMTMYTTTNSVADAAAFYREQMEGLGWTLQSELGDSNVGLQQTYSRDSETVLITISIDSGSGNTMVAIVTQ